MSRKGVKRLAVGGGGLNCRLREKLPVASARESVVCPFSAFRDVQAPVHVHDLHATILHLLGFDHEAFTYRFAGRDFRLTDVHGHVVKALLA